MTDNVYNTYINKLLDRYGDTLLEKIVANVNAKNNKILETVNQITTRLDTLEQLNADIDQCDAEEKLETEKQRVESVILETFRSLHTMEPPQFKHINTRRGDYHKEFDRLDKDLCKYIIYVLKFKYFPVRAPNNSHPDLQRVSGRHPYICCIQGIPI